MASLDLLGLLCAEFFALWGGEKGNGGSIRGQKLVLPGTGLANSACELTGAVATREGDCAVTTPALSPATLVFRGQEGLLGK